MGASEVIGGIPDPSRHHPPLGLPCHRWHGERTGTGCPGHGALGPPSGKSLGGKSRGIPWENHPWGHVPCATDADATGIKVSWECLGDYG